MKDKCFVIQPFDKGTFDKRFTDIFEPAIKNAELEPYRVDRDVNVRIPIEDIEKEIRSSRICFAEITTDNPNVWYELGFAFASGKDVVMVCSDERDKYPFDIAHKIILTYQTSSISDFAALGTQITTKLQALISTSEKAEILQSTPFSAVEGLKSHEIAMLLLIMENSLSSEDTSYLYTLRSEMEKAGYTAIATSIAVRTLTANKMIETLTETDHNGEEYACCRLLESGVEWVLANQDKIEFRKNIPVEDNPVPF